MHAVGVFGALLTAALSAASAPVVAPEYFVAPDGDDSNPGTESRPFQTLGRAQAAIREAKLAAGLPSQGITVTLRGGLYRLTRTLEIMPIDSGTPDRRVTWRAYRGERPRISGGVVVTGWTPVEPDDVNRSRIHTTAPLFRAAIRLESFGDGTPPREAGAIAELFYNRVPMRLGRWPKPGAKTAGMVGITGAGRSLRSAEHLPARGWSEAAHSPPENRPWAYINRNGYSDAMLRIDAVSGDDLTLATPAAELGRNAAWFATNLLEEVSDPGEYWIDRVRGIVYFRPPDGANPDESRGEAVVSALSTPLVKMNRSSGYVRFEGITFEAGQRDLVVVNGTGHMLRNCTFRNAGNSALILAGSGHVIAGAEIHGIGNAGVLMNGRGVGRDIYTTSDPGSKNASSGITIRDSRIHHVGRNLHNGMAALVVAGARHHIHNNEIHHLPWSAILYHGKNGLIERNEFYATQQEGGDTGTIYVSCNTDSATEIRHNYFHDVLRPQPPWTTGSHRAAIYFDTDPGMPDTSGFAVHGNLIHRYGDGTLRDQRARGVGIENKGSGNTFRRNLFVRVDVPYLTGYLGRPEAFTGNQAWRSGTPLPAGNVMRDPGFVDEDRGKLSPRPDGDLPVADEQGVIPLSRIGVGRGGPPR